MLQSYIYSKVAAPDLLNDYDAIGFDINCLMKITDWFEFSKFMVKTLLMGLHDNFEEWYPQIIADIDYEKIQSVWLNGAIWDTDNGTILKLSEDNRITHAILGF